MEVAVEVGIHIIFPRKRVQRRELRLTGLELEVGDDDCIQLLFQKCKYICLGIHGDNSFK